MENVTNGIVPAPATVENADTKITPPAAVESPPITRSQPVEIRHRQLPCIDIKDGAEQELKEEDFLTSACH